MGDSTILDIMLHRNGKQYRKSTRLISTLSSTSGNDFKMMAFQLATKFAEMTHDVRYSELGEERYKAERGAGIFETRDSLFDFSSEKRPDDYYLKDGRITRD